MGKVKCSIENGLATVTLADPATLNAAGLDMLEELIATFKSLEGQARAVIITGEGRGFCSGANISASGRATPDGKPRTPGSSLESHYNPFVTTLRDLPFPIVTAINGVAAGVGCSLALMGDIIVAAESAYFLQAFRRIGLVPDGGSSYILPRTIGRARAMEMMMLGEKIPAAKALDWGLINRCVPDAELMPTASAIASELANGPASLALIRKMVWDGLDAHWRDQLSVEAKTQNRAGETADYQEGVSAFQQKRPAKFKGK